MDLQKLKKSLFTLMGSASQKTLDPQQPQSEILLDYSQLYFSSVFVCVLSSEV